MRSASARVGRYGRKTSLDSGGLKWPRSSMPLSPFVELDMFPESNIEAARALMASGADLLVSYFC